MNKTQTNLYALRLRHAYSKRMNMDKLLNTKQTKAEVAKSSNRHIMSLCADNMAFYKETPKKSIKQPPE